MAVFQNTIKLCCFAFVFICLAGCDEEEVIYLDKVRLIKISDEECVDNGIVIRDPVFNFSVYADFIKYLSSSDRFLIVQQKDLNRINSKDKVIISLRHDVDDNINSAVKMAYIESKYGVKSSFYILHTAGYYGKIIQNKFIRSDIIINYIRVLQNEFQHEIGVHNDLVTLQIIYGLSPRDYLKKELEWLRSNGIKILGMASHGSQYCDYYHYLNSYFWSDISGRTDGNYYNTEVIRKGFQIFHIEKDSMKNYQIDYDEFFLNYDYFYSDSDRINGERWNMNMINLDTVPLGKKIILLFHPQHWD